MTAALQERIRLVTVKVRCVSCRATKEVRADSIPKDEMPMCDLCYSPMVAVSAKSKR